MKDKPEIKTILLRVPMDIAEGFEATAAFRGESVNAAIVAGMKELSFSTFQSEIKAGENILLRKLPTELWLKDVCEAMGIEFGKG